MTDELNDNKPATAVERVASKEFETLLKKLEKESQLRKNAEIRASELEKELQEKEKDLTATTNSLKALQQQISNAVSAMDELSHEFYSFGKEEKNGK